MSEFEESVDTSASDAGVSGEADSGAEGSGLREAGESGSGGAAQGAGQAPQQSASAAPAQAAPTGLSREQFEAAVRQRDSYWQSQHRALQAEVARLKRQQQPPAPSAPERGPVPTLQEWIQKGYSPESWELFNGMSQYYDKKHKDFESRYENLRGELDGHRRQVKQREIEAHLDKGWNDALGEVYSSEYKHLSGNEALDGLLKKVLFVEAFQALQAKRDPRYLDNRSVLRGVLSVVDKLVKAQMAKQVKTAPAPAAPAAKGAPTKPGEQKTKSKSEKEFFDRIAARARAAID